MMEFVRLFCLDCAIKQNRYIRCSLMIHDIKMIEYEYMYINENIYFFIDFMTGQLWLLAKPLHSLSSSVSQWCSTGKII